MKKILILGIIFILIFTICAGLNSQTAAGKTGGKLILYDSQEEPNAKKVLDAFTKETNIQVEFVFLSTGPVIARMTAEKDNPQADAWMGAPHENHEYIKEQGLSIPYKSPAWEKVNPKYKDADGYWRCYYMDPVGIGVNTDILKKLKLPKPTSWDDLLKPIYKGQIQTPTPQTSGTAFTILLNLIKIKGSEDAAFAYMKKLNANIQTYPSAGTASAQACSLGQCAIAIQFSPAYFEFADKGYPIEVIFPKEGVGYQTPAVSILKGAKNLENAKIFVDWLMSKNAQDVWADGKTFDYPLNPQSKVLKDLPSLEKVKLISIDLKYASENKKRLIERWVNEVLPAK